MHAADIDRRIENLAQLGTIAAVDHQRARCRVHAGDLLTAPIPWLTQRAGNAATWWAPSVGEQVLLISPGGDPARGIVLPAVFSTANPAPDDAALKQVTLYPDGAVLYYDAAQHVLSCTLPAGGKVQVAAPGGVTVTGDVAIEGKLHVTDKVTADADIDCAATVTAATDVKADGVSLTTHKHKGVTAGSGVSGPPQK
jgi:phage baseplate assembly protein V